MDADRFDRATRLFHEMASRRGVLGLLSGLSLATVPIGGTAKMKNKKNKKQKDPPNLCTGLIDQTSCDRFIGGNALPLIPQGTAGVLDVVAMGQYDGLSLPFVIRNNTGTDVQDVSATATVRNAAGQLIGSGADQGIEPNVLRAGSVGMGYIYFRGVEFGPDSIFSINLEAADESNSRFENERDLVFGEANYIDGRVVGAMTNGYTESLEGPIGFAITCFNEAGHILSEDSEFSGDDTLGPGEQAFFQFSSFSEPLNCPTFLITGSGFSST